MYSYYNDLVLILILIVFHDKLLFPAKLLLLIFIIAL